jgi:Icc-related predicted phosphoesterase
MRLVCISDTHGHDLEKLKLPEGDILLHAGDVSDRGTIAEIAMFNSHCAKVKHLYTHGIYTCMGNHDFLAEKAHIMCQELLSNCKMMINKSITIDGLNFYFSPYTPWFFNWAFNFKEQDLEQARNHWARIPDDTNVLITHGPPRTLLDITPRGQHVGCGPLLHRTLDLQNLLLHVFGHIHCGYSHEQHRNKHYINASSCNEQYHLCNPAYVVDIDTNNLKVIEVSNGKGKIS